MKFWDKFHLCCSENGKLHSASPRAIFAILTITLVKFIPNFTPSHAITYTSNTECSNTTEINCNAQVVLSGFSHGSRWGYQSPHEAKSNEATIQDLLV